MFFSRSKSKLGIDIGTSSIKVVQIKHDDNQFLLETYGIVEISERFGQKGGFDPIVDTAKVIKELLERSKTTSKKVIASLPNNIVFVTMIKMPKMAEKELKQAIEWEARRYVPLPLEEVTLSWSVFEENGEESKEQNDQQLPVLLTAVPTTVVENYLKMFKVAGLEPDALEIEALALIRSLVGSGTTGSFILVDVGARSTSLNLVDHGFLRISRNISVGGDTITSAIAQGLKVSPTRAEKFKRDMGMTRDLTQHIPQAMRPSIEAIRDEINQLLKIYGSSGKNIQEIIFAGSGANLPGIVEQFSDIGVKVSLGDPLKFISYDSQLKSTLEQISLSLSVATGLAMRD